MEVFTTGAALREALASTTGIRGFVPTMGALHAGHRSLVERCHAECGVTVVSLFVNPTQFNDPNDLKNYPRDLAKDLAMLREAGADFVYAPSVEDVYPEPDTRTFDFGRLDSVMEGAHRPGHFNGVAQVVTRLFDIVEPDRAYFGEKDFQQIAVIRHIVRTLGYDVEIVDCPIIREADGLAMSSRNLLLTPAHRAAAPLIYKTLSEAAAQAQAGNLSVAEVHDRVVAAIDADPLLETEYFSLADADTLQPVDDWNGGRAVRGFIAVRAGNVRLIDNIRLR